MIDAIGAQRSLIILMTAFAVLAAVMALAQDGWGNDLVLMGYFFGADLIAILATIAMIPIAMRLCSPAVAATQFTIYMATANLGRPLGAWLAAASAGAGHPALLYWLVGASWLVIAGLLLVVRFPVGDRAFHDTAEQLPQGEGLAPVRD